MSKIPEFLLTKLKKRKDDGSFRKLESLGSRIDFCSNDYLGFAQNQGLTDAAEQLQKSKSNLLGSTGSRLISGQTEFIKDLESTIAQFHTGETALIFNSGYDANIGLISALSRRGVTILYDSEIHVSVKEGARLGNGKFFNFKHNNCEDLKKKLEQHDSPCFVMVESIYSMGGDQGLLQEISSVCAEKGAFLIVDEAHGVGLYGPNGSGLVCELGLEKKVFGRVVTFGKGLGAHGAAVIGDQVLTDYLVNYARSFIYTTALPFSSLAMISCAYQKLIAGETERKVLFGLIKYFRKQIVNLPGNHYLESGSPIQSVLIPGNGPVKQCADALWTDGYAVKAIRSPTVPAGKERLRICLHVFNTKKEIDGLVKRVRHFMVS